MLLALLPLLRAVPARVLVAGAALPVALLVALSVKNAILFGTPSTSSWLGENLARVGIYTAPLDRRRAYVAAGELDPVELIPPYAKLRAYNGAIRFAKPRGVRESRKRCIRICCATAGQHTYWSAGPI